MEFHNNGLNNVKHRAASGKKWNRESSWMLRRRKLKNRLQAAENNKLFEKENISFCSEIKKMFEQYEIIGYIDNIKRIGASCCSRQLEIEPFRTI